MSPVYRNAANPLLRVADIQFSPYTYIGRLDGPDIVLSIGPDVDTRETWERWRPTPARAVKQALERGTTPDLFLRVQRRLYQFVGGTRINRKAFPPAVAR